MFVLELDVSRLTLAQSCMLIQLGVFNPALLVTVIVTQTFTVGTSISSVQTSTIVSTRTSTTSSQTSTALPTTQACLRNGISCPASFGGGCCESDYTCAPSRSCIAPSGVTPTTTASPNMPIRPTTATGPSFVFPTTSSPPQDTGACPTGFYACSAYYRGGCCRTGRNCQTTDCPITSSTTLISDGLTLVVPAGSAAALNSPTGECATGWSSCAASLGGNCCPTGYECGTASCSSLSPTQTAVVQKGSPNSAASRGAVGFVALTAVPLVMLMVLM